MGGLCLARADGGRSGPGFEIHQVAKTLSRVSSWIAYGPSVPPDYTSFRSIRSLGYGRRYTSWCTHANIDWASRPDWPSLTRAPDEGQSFW
jgi:hypothetical protein